LVPRYRLEAPSKHKNTADYAKMSPDDMQARLLGLRVGDVVHVLQRDGSESYRVVAELPHSIS
jgi:hypothetical protein